MSKHTSELLNKLYDNYTTMRIDPVCLLGHYNCSFRVSFDKNGFVSQYLLNNNELETIGLEEVLLDRLDSFLKYCKDRRMGAL